MSTKRKKRRAKRAVHTLGSVARSVERVYELLQNIHETNAVSAMLRVLSAQERVPLTAICKLAADFAQADPLIDADKFSDAGRTLRAALIVAGFIPFDAPTDPSEQTPVVLCSQVIGPTAEHCTVPADYMFTWPGSAAKPICAKCSLQASAVAKSLGFDVPMVPVRS